jgi:hypothetical protein
MNKRIQFALAIAVAFASRTAFAEDFELFNSDVEPVSFQGVGYNGYDAKDETNSKCGGCGICDDCCGCGGGWFVDVEANLMRFSREGGDKLGRAFNHEITPRVTVGYVGPSGLGIRARYWDFAHTSKESMYSYLNVDTFNLDLELFRRCELCCSTTVEWSAGVRYNDYKIEDKITNVDQVLAAWDEFQDLGYNNWAEQFSGLGGVFGLKVNHCFWRGEFYGRARWSILHSDDERSQMQGYWGDDGEAVMINGREAQAKDLIHMQTELAIGYEMKHCLCNGMVLSARVGYEWQYWDSYDIFTGDGIGFDGVILGVGLSR